MLRSELHLRGINKLMVSKLYRNQLQHYYNHLCYVMFLIDTGKRTNKWSTRMGIHDAHSQCTHTGKMACLTRNLLHVPACITHTLVLTTVTIF